MVVLFPVFSKSYAGPPIKVYACSQNALQVERVICFLYSRSCAKMFPGHEGNNSVTEISTCSIPLIAHISFSKLMSEFKSSKAAIADKS